MTSHAEWSDLLDNTMAVLQVDAPVLTPQTGKGILDEWISAVSQGENTTELVDSLEELKTQLESNSGSDTIVTLLQQLADQTAEFSTMVGAEGDMSTRLEALASALRALGGQLENP